ncbi:MAG: type II toxin-antitoxin system RelE/ParE family toxin [Flavobacteriales bacterium]|nr:type II toxin-antitoxin system RelE/ParE family toxin [Flavobacteriales bacterium]
MKFEVAVLAPFLKDLKRLAKRYPSLKGEIVELSAKLEVDPAIGTPIGRNCYKIRIAIASKGKGKRGGGRVITHVHVKRTMVYLLDLYDKSEKADLSPGDLEELLKSIP